MNSIQRGDVILDIRDLKADVAGRNILKGLNLTVRAGEVHAIMGPNGAGKTTCMSSIVGFLPPRDGEIRLFGEIITRLSPEAISRKGVGFVPQGRRVFASLTVRENLETGFAVLPRGERRVPDEIFDLFPVLKSMLRRRGGDLSGGQQQQLAIARALVTKPRLLVLDEPTEGIQPSIIKDIGRVIELLRGRGEMAILLVEQYFDFAEALAQAMAVMDRGDIVLSGRREELDREDVRRRLSV